MTKRTSHKIRRLCYTASRTFGGVTLTRFKGPRPLSNDSRWPVGAGFFVLWGS
jgi:hypothetical protein